VTLGKPPQACQKLSSFNSNREHNHTMRDQYVFSNQKSKISYESQPVSCRKFSLSQTNNPTLQEQFGTSKTLIKEVDEEESVKELEQYCNDDSTFKYKQEDTGIAGQNTAAYDSSAKKIDYSTIQPESYHVENASVYSIYDRPTQKRAYNSRIDHYEPLRPNISRNEQRLNTFAASDDFESRYDYENERHDTLYDLKDQFYNSQKKNDPYIDDNVSLSNLNNLVANSHDWKNIQEVVRIAFKYVSDSIHAQESQLKFVVSELNSKVTKNELDTKLSNKPSYSEMNELFSNCVEKLDSKVDVSDSILTGMVNSS